VDSFPILATAIPVVHETVSLRELGRRIGGMASKEEVVSGIDFPSCEEKRGSDNVQNEKKVVTHRNA
jgi:hypothetical protein